MNELSLFSGAGGGLLASKYFLKWKTIGYVEYEEYCQKVIRQRIKDGLLDNAPIFGDIRTFINSGCASLYRGITDVISAGFPCQPFSVAGKRQAEKDERNMWPATLRAIDIIRPKYAFLENVPGLISCGYIGDILSGLAKIGYNAKWCCLSSAETGGPIVGERLWFLATSDKKRWFQGKEIRKRTDFKIKIRGRKTWPCLQNVKKDWLVANSLISNKPYDVAEWVGQFEAIGNGQDPILAATAWRLLSE